VAGPPKANSIASGSRPSLAPATATAQPPHPMIEIDGPDGNPANPCLVGGHRHRAPGVRRRWFGAPGTRRDAFSAMRYCTSTVPGAGWVCKNFRGDCSTGRFWGEGKKVRPDRTATPQELSSPPAPASRAAALSRFGILDLAPRFFKLFFETDG
jgi:hypothetical protein